MVLVLNNRNSNLSVWQDQNKELEQEIETLDNKRQDSLKQIDDIKVSIPKEQERHDKEIKKVIADVVKKGDQRTDDERYNSFLDVLNRSRSYTESQRTNGNN